MTNRALRNDVSFTLFQATDGSLWLVEVLLRLEAGSAVAKRTSSESPRMFSAPWDAEKKTQGHFSLTREEGRLPDTHPPCRWQESDPAGDFGPGAEVETWRERRPHRNQNAKPTSAMWSHPRKKGILLFSLVPCACLSWPPDCSRTPPALSHSCPGYH